MRTFYWWPTGAMCLAAGGCTAESTRIAIETQRRADQVQEAIFDRQHDGLRLLLYRDAVQRLAHAAGEGGFDATQQSVLNDVWNERDLLEFWRVQFERSKALRLIGVDAKLYSDQAVIDLLIKALSAKAGRVNEGLAAAAGAMAAERGLEAVAGVTPSARSGGNSPAADAAAPDEKPGPGETSERSSERSDGDER